VHPEEQIVGHDAAYMSAQRMPDTSGPHNWQAEISQDRQDTGETSRYRSHVLYRGRITWSRAQCTPINHEYIIAAIPQISVAQDCDRQYTVSTYTR